MPMAMASLETIPDDMLDLILSKVPRRWWQCSNFRHEAWGLCLVCKRWKEWVKSQDRKECVGLQPKERLILLCSSDTFRLVPAEGYLSEDRSLITVTVFAHGGAEEVLSGDGFAPTFRDGHLELVRRFSRSGKCEKICHDLSPDTSGWAADRVGCEDSGSRAFYDDGRGCGFGPCGTILIVRRFGNPRCSEGWTLREDGKCKPLAQLADNRTIMDNLQVW